MEAAGRKRGSLFRIRIAVAAAALVISLLFAAVTNHVFEDYLITYKCSKNLAQGNGLVFHAGERVHTFTSPIGVLVPAALCWITQNRSDTLVIWLFRLISAGLLSLSAVLVFETFRAAKLAPIALVVGTGLVLTDAKTIDFSINGMETAFLVAATILMLYSWLGKAGRPRLLLALSWAGLMWTRPDGFVYAGSFAFAAVVFGVGPGGEPSRRRDVVRAMAPALGLAVALYLPWLTWAWIYYGTPVPHTVVAKGVHHDYSLAGLATELALFPVSALKPTASPAQSLLPAYAWIGGWSTAFPLVMAQIAWVAAFHWFVPFASRAARTLSLAACVSHFYLTVFCPLVFPWYLPPATMLTLFSLVFLVDALLRRWASPSPAEGWRAPFRAAPRTTIFAVALLAVNAVLLVASARQMAMQQELIENSHRKALGKWLAANAGPGDTVFLECLGYIGYYSGLKTYDHPGLSSPEVVAVRRQLPPPPPGKPPHYGAVIEALRPDWLVLRAGELGWVHEQSAAILTRDYTLAATADVSEKLAAARFLPGRGYLRFDSVFYCYRRNAGADPGRPAPPE